MKLNRSCNHYDVALHLTSLFLLGWVGSPEGIRKENHRGIGEDGSNLKNTFPLHGQIFFKFAGPFQIFLGMGFSLEIIQKSVRPLMSCVRPVEHAVMFYWFTSQQAPAAVFFVHPTV